MYEYKRSKETVEAILKSPTKIVEKDNIPSSDAEFTYENGILSYTVDQFPLHGMVVIDK